MRDSNAVSPRVYIALILRENVLVPSRQYLAARLDSDSGREGV